MVYCMVFSSLDIHGLKCMQWDLVFLPVAMQLDTSVVVCSALISEIPWFESQWRPTFPQWQTSFKLFSVRCHIIDLTFNGRLFSRFWQTRFYEL